MTGARHAVALLLCLSVILPARLTSQSKESDNTQKAGEPDLKMKIIGHGRMSTGAVAGFRVYAAADGNEARVWYADFQSNEQLSSEIANWLKPFEITSREQIKNQSGQVIGERIVAFIQHSNPSGKEFLLIRQYGLAGYFISSYSLAVAKQVDALIEPPSEPSESSETKPGLRPD